MLKAGYLLFLFVCMHLYFFADAQPGTTIDLKKPDKYESRTLGSEKTTESKIKTTKKFYQNTITHYNYYFNASLRLEEIIEKAKEGFKDDYTKLLPYYGYDLNVTAADPDIDTVIYKCNAGILLHDLRNDWVDDLYFLMGKAYYLRKNFDSAAHVFSYVSYAFAKKEDGYDVPVGSNAGGTEFSIATKEKNGVFRHTPRRNEDLIWIAKNYIDAGRPYEASAILEMLRNDPNFPDRLEAELHETMGYLFYQSGSYDSAAFHLSKATDMDDDKHDKARREYLTGQLYLAAGSKEDAEKYFTRSAQHTVDPYMAVYASLNAINASADSSNVGEKKIAALMSLAKRDRYVAYRDLIYFTAAQVEMENNNDSAAYNFAKKSIKYNVNSPVQRSQGFMLLGDLDYMRPDYVTAKNEYDSVDASSLASEADQQRLAERLPALQAIVANIKTVKIEDSLQIVARMPEADRTAFIRKKVRQLRKAQGLKESDTSTFVNPAVQTQGDNNPNAPNNDLFSVQAAAKGDWYFNNNTLKSTGFSTFRTSWGNRPNVDNWRRMDAVTKQIAAVNKGNPDERDSTEDDSSGDNAVENDQTVVLSSNPEEEVMSGEISYDALLAYLPLTEEKLKESNKKIEAALFNNGVQFQNTLEDYNAAIESYDSLLKRFPDNEHLEEVLYNMYYCYKKLGKKFSADSALTVLKTKYKDGKFTQMLAHKPAVTETIGEDAATKEYEKIYDMFIEGKFDEAKAAKATADSLYGNSHWTPQLLYIESIYLVSKHEDSSAIETLTSLKDQFAGSPMAAKAETMIDVLSRRAEIEDYLTNLQITRLPEDEPAPIVNLNRPVAKISEKQEIKSDSMVTSPAKKVAAPAIVDSFKTVTGTAVRTYVFNASDSQFVGIILNKVDPVYINETRNAFKRYNGANFYNQEIDITSSKLNDSLNMVLLGPFADAASATIYLDKVKPKAPGVIIPWLKPEKYSFTIISQPNLDILNDTKDLNGYKALLEKVLPGKF
jgi:tetratricopeptide (TPR) repeat protein